MLALVSSICWGTSDFLGGTLARRKPVVAIVGFGQFFGLGAMALIALLTQAWEAPLSYVPWAIVAATAGGLGLWAFYTALAVGQMGVVSPIAATGIVIPMLGGLLVGDIPNTLQAIGVFVAIVGLFMVVLPGKLEDGGVNRRSVGLAFISAVMFGTSLACIAQGSLISPVMTMVTMRLWSVAVLLVVALFVRTLGGMGWRGVGAAAVVGLLDVAANLTFGLASATGELVVAAVLGSLYPVMTVLLAWLIQHERLRGLQYVGIAFALAGVVLMSVR